MLSRFLFSKIDNAPLIIFRIFFGILVALECFGAIATGWIKRTLIEPHFTFNFIGFDWIQPLPGNGMYFYFFVMGSLGLLIALGYKYRLAIISFTILWTGVYLMQKTSYNNHYYLLVLVSGIMCLFPAHKSYSLDARANKTLQTNTMFAWVRWAIVLQLLIVYVYAAIAKMYGDWLDFGIIRILMLNKAHYYLIGEPLQNPIIHKIIGAVGILFDLFIIPALLWKKTRKAAFFISIFFHLFNSIVFQIGIFPYLSLAFSVFFFEPKTIRNIFFKRVKIYVERDSKGLSPIKPENRSSTEKISLSSTEKTALPSEEKIFSSSKIELPPSAKWVYILGGLYFIIQLALPLRQHMIKDDVLWTEEGHRLSWRMMLRSRSGTLEFKVIEKESGAVHMVDRKDHLSKKQNRRIAAYPDFIWQFAQYLKKQYAEKNIDISVYAVNSKVSINGKPYRAFIDPKTDLAAAKWNYFWHNDWILPGPDLDKSTPVVYPIK